MEDLKNMQNQEKKELFFFLACRVAVVKGRQNYSPIKQEIALYT